jgi:hypothetical protein
MTSASRRARSTIDAVGRVATSCTCADTPRAASAPARYSRTWVK